MYLLTYRLSSVIIKTYHPRLSRPQCCPWYIAWLSYQVSRPLLQNHSQARHHHQMHSCQTIALYLISIVSLIHFYHIIGHESWIQRCLGPRILTISWILGDMGYFDKNLMLCWRRNRNLLVGQAYRWLVRAPDDNCHHPDSGSHYELFSLLECQALKLIERAFNSIVPFQV